MVITKKEGYLPPGVEWTTLEPLCGVLKNSIEFSYEDEEEDWED